MIEMNGENIKELMTGKSVIIDFWADWCGPCHMLAPIIAEIAEELKDKVKEYLGFLNQNSKILRVYVIESFSFLRSFLL